MMTVIGWIIGGVIGVILLAIRIELQTWARAPRRDRWRRRR